jgi:cytochrome c
MKWILAALCCAALPLIAAAQGDEYGRGFALAMRKGCFECHGIGHGDSGPSFRTIADRYRFDLVGQERLPQVVRGGSAGHWGERFVMWPQTQLTAEEAAQLVQWVLSQ